MQDPIADGYPPAVISNFCVRCGRARAAAESEREHRGSQPRDSPAAGVWALLADGDVCPTCQSPQERREVEIRLTEAIGAEIRRRADLGENPDQREATLIDLAMEIRTRAVQPGEAETPNERGSARASADVPELGDTLDTSVGQLSDVDPLRRAQLRVAITGAFLTGSPVAVHASSYAQAQEALARSLRSPNWTVADLPVREGTFQSGGGFTSSAPLVIARRNGADLLVQLASALKEARRRDERPLSERDGAFTLEPDDLTIDVYDLGVAVLTAWFDVNIATDNEAPLAHVAAAVRRMVLLRSDAGTMPPLSMALQRIASGVASDYADAASRLRTSVSTSFTTASSVRLPLASDRRDERGRLLWLHPINVLTTDEPAGAAQHLAPRVCKIINVEGGRFAAGVGWSALAVSSPASTEQGVPIVLTELHWAYFALYMEIDRGLLDILDQPRWNEPLSLNELEQDADAVFADYLWVMTARARLDSALAAKGGDELAIWEAIAKVQRFDTVVQAVDRKLEVLEDLAKRRVDQANAYRTRRTADGLGYLNVLTLVTVTVAIIGAIFGSRSNGLNSLWVRVPLIVVAVLLAAIVYWLVFVRTSRRPRPRPRPRSLWWP